MGRTGAFDAIVGHSDEGTPLQHCPACGPTLLLTRSARAGDHFGCPACTACFAWTDTQQGLRALPTGEHASAHELEPELDQIQIEALVQEWGNAVAAL